MTEYDIDIDNYTEYELLRILKIKEEINTLSIQQLNDHIDKIIIKLKSNEEYNLIGFIKLAGEKLQKSLIKKHDIIENNNPYPLVQHTQPSAVNTTQTYYPKGVINPIDKKTITKVINIDTIFRENYKNTKSSDFVWHLTQSETNVVSMRISSVDIPISWYNIVDDMERNKFNIVISNIQNVQNQLYTITIPPGNYNNITFINTINNIFYTNHDNFLQNFYTEINEITKNIVFKLKNYDELYNENKNLEIVFDFFINKKKYSLKQMDYEFQKTVGWNIGFRKTKYIINNTFSEINNYIQSETLFNLKHDDYIFINLDDYNSNCVCQPIVSSTWNSYIGNNILGRITIDSTYKNTHYDNGNDHIFKERVYLGPVSVEKFKIQILNKFGETIDLNNSNFSFTLELTKLY
jgi:hypothetical protein